MHLYMPWIVIAAIGLWFFFGTPAKTLANWFWTDSAAPWETVDAFYYPDRSDLTNNLYARRSFAVSLGLDEAASDAGDGIRIRAANGDIVHIRASGNALELRVYVETSSPDGARRLLASAIAQIPGLLEVSTPD